MKNSKIGLSFSLLCLSITVSLLRSRNKLKFVEHLLQIDQI